MNPERKALYQFRWHLGASQGDIANLKGEDVDWAKSDRKFYPPEITGAGVGAFGWRSLKPLQRPPSRRHLVSVFIAYAIHSLEQGANPRAIQEVMGHKSLETTMGYLHAESLSVASPLENLARLVEKPEIISGGS